MKIQSLSVSNYQTNFRSSITKKAFCTVATGLASAAILGKQKFDEQKIDDEIFDEDLSDVEENDDNIFDEEYYQAYYNIDLNLAKNRAFRDNELFNPLRDVENSGYHFYDEDDIKIADNLIYKNKINEYTTEYKLSDTDFGDLKIPDSVTKPDLDDLRINEQYSKLKKLNKQLQVLGRGSITKQCILESCRKENTRFNEVDFELVDIAVRLLKNNKHHFWNDNENDLIYNIIDILKNADKKRYENLVRFIDIHLFANFPNNKILELLREASNV